MTSCEYPNCEAPIVPPVQTSSTTLVHPQPKPDTLPFTGADIGLIFGIAVLVLVLGAMALYSTQGWDWIKDHFRG